MKSLDCCSWASLVSPCLGSYMLCDFWWRHVFDRLACTGPGCHLFCWLWMPVKLLTAGIAKVFKQRIEMRWTCGQDLEEIKKTCSKKWRNVKHSKTEFQIICCFVFCFRGPAYLKRGGFWVWLVGRIYDTEVINAPIWMKESKIDVELMLRSSGLNVTQLLFDTLRLEVVLRRLRFESTTDTWSP